MRGTRKGIAAGSVAFLLAGCGAPYDGVVTDPSSPAEDRRAEAYDWYADEEGKSPAWVDQHMCMVGSAFAVLNEVHRHEGTLTEDTWQDEVNEATMIGDDHLVAGLRAGREQGEMLVTDPSRTVREAVTAAIGPCETDELAADEVAETVDDVIWTAVDGYAGLWPSLAWEGRDGTRVMPTEPPLEPIVPRSEMPAPESPLEEAEGGWLRRNGLWCEEVMAGTIIEYVAGDIDEATALGRFVLSAREDVGEMLEYALEEVESGALAPDDAAMVMGNAGTGPICLDR